MTAQPLLQPGITLLSSDFPAAGTLREVSPGLFWHRIPMEGGLDHVNCYVIDDGDGWFVLDAGLNDAVSKASWEAVLSGPLAGKPVTRVMISHHHPDHVGAAGWLVERTGATLLMPQVEYLLTQVRVAGLFAGTRTHDEAFYRDRGLADEVIEGFLARGPLYQVNVAPLPKLYQRLATGQRLQIGGSQWQVLTWGGHSDAQASLWCAERGVFLAVDQIMAQITPNIAVWPVEPDARPLDEFRAALAMIRATVPDEAQVYAGHKQPFTGLHARVSELEAHHTKICTKILEAAREVSTVAEVVPRLFRRELNAHHTGLAFAETLAHVNTLICEGSLASFKGDDGRWRVQSL